MSFVQVAALGELQPDTPLRVEVDGVPVSLVRHTATEPPEVFAINDTCSHADVSLAEGEVDDCTIECWLHGSRFDLRSGKPTGLPATQPVDVYPVRVEGDGPDAAVLVDVTSPLPV